MSQSPTPAWDRLLAFVLGDDEALSREEVRAALDDFAIDLRPAARRVNQALHSMRAGLVVDTPEADATALLLTPEDVAAIVWECHHVRQLLGHTPGPIGAVVGTTLGNIIVSWSPEAELLYGYSAAEMTGRPLASLDAGCGVDDLSNVMARVNRGERVAPVRMTRVRKDGRRFTAEIGLCRVRNGAGRQVGALTVAYPTEE
jgi:PAS domain S-box-containing protein